MFLNTNTEIKLKILLCLVCFLQKVTFNKNTSAYLYSEILCTVTLCIEENISKNICKTGKYFDHMHGIFPSYPESLIAHKILYIEFGVISMLRHIEVYPHIKSIPATTCIRGAMLQKNCVDIQCSLPASNELCIENKKVLDRTILHRCEPNSYSNKS